MQRTRTPHLLKASMVTIGSLALVGATFTGTASATSEHAKADKPSHEVKADHGQGAKPDKAQGAKDDDVRAAKAGKAEKADKADKGSTWTEDNDTNDGGTPNNVADDGDNRHPSGKDRSVEHGGSGNQGKSASDPDGMKNGGADKPNGPGGIDKADQDGNNGCGNDDDFEDDNNGNCGGKAHVKPEASKPAKADTCSCDHTPPTVKPAEHPKPVKAEHPKPVKEEHAKPAVVEHPKDHGTTSCDRRNDERGQRAVRAEHQKTVVPVTVPTPPAETPAVDVPTPVLGTPAATPICDNAAGMEADVLAGCQQAASVPADVLAEHAVAAPASAETPTTLPTRVLAAEATAPSSNGGGNVVATAAGAALAFTGSNIVVLLAAALITLLVGWVLVRADRRQNA
jgi:hypothetical protein